MKKSSILFTLFLSLNLVAQQNSISPCAFVETEEQREKLMKLKPLLHTYEKSEDMYYIPIRFHNVAKDDGSGRWTKWDCIQNIADANEDYAPYNIQFYLHENQIDDHNNTNVYDHDNYGVDGFMNSNDDETAVNVYMVINPAGACGYYTYGGDGIMINHDCADAGSTTLSHELGHYFYLPHTFSGWENENTPSNFNIERVPRTGSGANCNSAGDSFCGTGPDYVSFRWNCPYAELEDPDGNAFTPDETFFMSYSSDNCQDKHSFDQVASVKATVDNFRTYLTNHDYSAAQNTDEIGVINLPYPANEAIVPSTVTLEWEPVEGATHYAVYITNTNEFTPMYDILTDQTSFTLDNLEDGERFLWKVRPYHLGDYSAFAPTERRFNVSTDYHLGVETMQVQNVSCLDGADGSISFEANGGTAPYEYVWEDGTEGNFIDGLVYGRYSVIVTDAEGLSNEIEFVITQPSEIEAEAIVGLNNTVAAVSGGTAPYTYEWSGSDETGKTVTDLQVGLNTLTVTDVNGCETSAEFVYIVPNVVKTNITCYGDNNGSLLIFGADGGEGSYTYTWEDGSNVLVRENLTGGDYTLYVEDSEGNTTVATYTIEEADSAIELDVTQLGQDIIILYSGGVEPINFIWSDGSTDNLRFNLAPGDYTVYITDALGCSISETYTVTDLSTTGIADLENASFNAFMDGNNQLIVDVNSPVNEVNFSIFDLTGKNLIQDLLPVGTYNDRYDLSTLSSGIYFVRFQINGKQETIKIVR